MAKVLGLEAKETAVDEQGRVEVTWQQFVAYLLKTSPEQDVSGLESMCFDSILPQNPHWKSYTDQCSPCLVNFTYIVHLEKATKMFMINADSPVNREIAKWTISYLGNSVFS